MLAGDGHPFVPCRRRRVVRGQPMTVTDVKERSAAAKVPVDPWHEEIVQKFQARLLTEGSGYEAIRVTFDELSLRYFDRALDEMSVGDGRLPHHLNLDRTLIRSAACDVVMDKFVVRRQAGSRGPHAKPIDLERALTGNLGDVLIAGLLQRLDPWGMAKLVPVELLVDQLVARRVDAELQRMVEQFESPDRELYLEESFPDFRSAFVEAGLLTWMLWEGLVAEEAVPPRARYLRLDVQQRASRRRRWLRTA